MPDVQAVSSSGVLVSIVVLPPTEFGVDQQSLDEILEYHIPSCFIYV